MADNLDNNIVDNIGLQGEEGYQGVQGMQGAQGRKGTRGAIGAQGAQGDQGMQGGVGAQGEKGFRGATGFKGETGAKGFQGAQGDKGAQGLQGTRGCDGAQGAAGSKGVTGPQGARGADGAQGARGASGADGAQGARGLDGVQGARGEKGKDGAQGARGEAGAQGEKGENGFDGAKGERGDKGAQGARGEKGDPGEKGEKGFQGATGAQGDKGAQGTRGCDGAQGAAGSKGITGPQGAKGDDGAQGTRGCEGAQGAKGTKGATGPQGARGENGAQGAQGARGSDGAQGARGAKGAQGARGEYGYQGDDGEIGYQGITGDEGAIWDDGIRLNGYNTHLFVYNYETRKFKPVGDDVMPDGQHNYLYIRNGATIKIWLDRNAYSLISENGEIVIDNIVNGEEIETNYKAYYANNTSIVSKINPERDLNGVIEFTFKDSGNAKGWYYSGGLLSSGSGGAQGVLYSGGKDINVRTGADESLIDTSLDNEIESCVTVGNVNAGDKIPAGSSLSEILEQILIKEFQAATEVPTSVLTVSPLKDSYSVGETLPTLNIGHNYADGKFKPSDGYPMTKFIQYNGSSKINAGCTEGETTYKYDGAVITLNEGLYTNSTPLTEGTHVFSCQTDYGSNTVIAKTNMNHDSTAKINAGKTAVSSKAFNVYYNVYVKESIENLPNDFRTLMTESNRHAITSNTVLYDVEYNIQPINYMVIIIPTVKDYIIYNSLGSVATSEYKANHVGTVMDNYGVEYNIYYKRNLSTLVSTYKWLTFENANTNNKE